MIDINLHILSFIYLTLLHLVVCFHEFLFKPGLDIFNLLFKFLSLDGLQGFSSGLEIIEVIHSHTVVD